MYEITNDKLLILYEHTFKFLLASCDFIFVIRIKITKIKSQQIVLRKLRTELGLLQQDVADYLGISKSLVAMHETGKRFLPDDAAKLSNELLALLDKEWSVKNKYDKKQVNKYAAQLSLQITRAERVLSRTKQLYIKAQKLHAITTDLLPRYNKQSTYKQQKLWLLAMQANSEKIMNDHNVTIQQLMQIKINSLKFQYQQVLLLK